LSVDSNQRETALNRYLDPRVIARYVEAEWADFLASCPGLAEHHSGLFDFGRRTLDFYKNALPWFLDHLGTPARILEAGAATGRVCWELTRVLPDAVEILGVDPSPLLTGLARQIVSGGPPPRFLPIPTGSARGYDFIDVDGVLNSVADQVRGRNLQFLQCGGEEVPRPRGYFDSIICLNVVDRHP